MEQREESMEAFTLSAYPSALKSLPPVFGIITLASILELLP
jgi:hypothetical protein